MMLDRREWTLAVLAAMGGANMHRAVNPYDENATYAAAHEISGPERWLFISGQVPETEEGVVPAGFEVQCRLAWANVERQLQAGDMSLDDLVKFTIFLSDRRYQAQEYEVRRSVLAGRGQPAMTIIITGIYDEAWLLEIEAIAAR
jgi:enamine deaminase RidA (YjgF/YER057c/UK114 family)